MRVEASDVARERSYTLRIQDPSPQSAPRAQKLAEIKATAFELANDFLLEYELPTAPVITLDTVRGFESTRKHLDQVNGVITFNVKFKTLAGHAIHFSLPFPVARGHILTPALAIYSGKKHIFSQEFINGLVDSREFIRPERINVYMKNDEIVHEELVQKDEFDAPDDPTGWSELVSERYT